MLGKRTLAIIGGAIVLAVVVVGIVLGVNGDDDAAASSADGVIEGTVTSGGSTPEAGVWVIAETEDLPTPYRKIVVTDDDGRFVLPELPEAGYQVWVRGYGLKDSAKTAAQPGATLEISAQVASPQEAAEVFPANYWLSLFEPPQGGGDWVSAFKLGCELCHQMGSRPTRLSDPAAIDAGLKKAAVMNATADGLGREELIDALADWGRRIQDGEVPETPPRPQGIERNIVITQWAWGDQFTYAHDEIATDKRDPTVNAGGKVYGVDLGNDRVLVVDPTTHEASTVDVPTRDGFDTPWCKQTYAGPPGSGADQKPQDGGFGTLGCPAPGGQSAFEGAYDNPANPHNPMMDADGKVWMTTQIRREHAEDLPEWCKDDPVILNNRHHRQLGYYDPDSGETELIDTCFGTHHLQFDQDGVLWVSGDSYVLGWFDPSKYDPERPETAEQAGGYAEITVDGDGDGTADTPIVGFNYGIIPNPTDGSVWTAQPSTNGAGLLTRFDPESKTFEAYAPPAPGRGPRGVDVDSNGVIWAALGGSGHLAKFDRSKCARTTGTGDQCPEGWTLYRSPGPLAQTDPGKGNQTNADFHYYLWVDQFDTLGMGEDTVILNGTGSDSLLAFDQETEKFTTIRVPYPMNLFTRGLDGRIDDPDAGWKGRGLWFDNGLDPLIHSEVPQSYIAQVQMRPDPLAR